MHKDAAMVEVRELWGSWVQEYIATQKWDLGVIMGDASGLRGSWVSSGLRRGIDDGADDRRNTLWDGRVLNDDVDG